MTSKYNKLLWLALAAGLTIRLAGSLWHIGQGFTWPDEPAQRREHWASDAVGGAFVGYAIGSLLRDQQQHKESGMRLSVTPRSVVANWDF